MLKYLESPKVKLACSWFDILFYGFGLYLIYMYQNIPSYFYIFIALDALPRFMAISMLFPSICSSVIGQIKSGQLTYIKRTNTVIVLNIISSISISYILYISGFLPYSIGFLILCMISEYIYTKMDKAVS